MDVFWARDAHELFLWESFVSAMLCRWILRLQPRDHRLSVGYVLTTGVRRADFNRLENCAAGRIIGGICLLSEYRTR